MANALFTVGILRDFVTQHFLIGGDWGRENQPHSHHYRMEVIFEGDRLDRHGYLLDIAEVEPRLDGIVERYRDRMLNELPEMAGVNPSLERFANVIADRLAQDLPAGQVTTLTVKLWESATAFATCGRTVGGSG
ncbi:MAG TPA: 6-carboxytetrahydropterin synthase [Polyangia bacterium]|jgi:6-pyruvoyltetrahydropterin/6-carboxytetrahydropterin synthase|nr:6-carboxytetrahydropterin synthase [Polyangia bacterium]